MTADTGTIFPDPLTAPGEIVAFGGDLEPETLLAAYRKGIFPWFSDDDPIFWWSLDPRFVLFPSELHVSRSLRKQIRQSGFRLTIDRDFEAVIRRCRDSPRPGQDGTWITREMEEAYIRLHRGGYAHSVEAWMGSDLVGGVYGVSLGGCYFGESMFHDVADASKAAFVALVGVLIDAGFGLVDCQQHTRHIESFGAVDVPRRQFLNLLSEELTKPTVQGSWSTAFPKFPASALWNGLTAGTGHW